VGDSRLRCPIAPYSPGTSDDARSRIVTLACGLPYYVQILGRSAALNAIAHRRTRIQIEDIYAAIDDFLIECGQSFAEDYQRATDSRHSGHIFQEVILANALELSDTSGCFKSSEVSKTLHFVRPDRDEKHSRIQQYLAQLISDGRGKILTRRGMRANYRYQFSDALMQPFIIMRAIRDGLISERLRQTLFHSGREQFRNEGYRLGVAEAYAAQLGMIIPTATEQEGR